MAPLIATAAALVAPQAPLDAAARLLAAYERLHLKSDGAAAEVVLIVSPEGRVVGCTTGRIAGEAKVAVRLCEGTVGMPFRPATVDSQASWGAMRTKLTITDHREQMAGMQQQLPHEADLTLRVAALPKGKTKPVTQSVVAQVAQDGSVIACQGGTPPFGEVACSQLRKHSYTALRDMSGNPVAYVRSFEVRFELDKTSK